MAKGNEVARQEDAWGDDSASNGTGRDVALIEGTQAQDMRGDPMGLEVQTRAEINQQISTAKRYPRSPEKFMKQALAMVSLDREIAASCEYSLPRKERDKRTGKMVTKLIKGPSVRLAEIIASCWGNLRIAGRIVGEDGMRVVAQGVCLDCEANLGYSMEVRRGILRSDGRRFTEDMVNVTSNAAIAIVTRNVTLKAVPRALVDVIYKHSRKVAMGDEKTLPARVEGAIKWFGRRGVKPEQLWAVLDVEGPADVMLEDLATLQGLRQAIDDGATTVEEVFMQSEAQPVHPQGGVTSQLSTLMERLEDANRKAREARARGEDPEGPTVEDAGTGMDVRREIAEREAQARADDARMEAERQGNPTAEPAPAAADMPREKPPRARGTSKPLPADEPEDEAPARRDAPAPREKPATEPQGAPEPVPETKPTRPLTAAEQRLAARRAKEEEERMP